MPDGVLGTTAGNYRILAKISDGGMGTVYRAEHVLIGRAVAVKVLQPELTGNREIVSRFFNEARATTAIKHPGIVEVFDFGYLDNGLAYIVMELLEGMTLARRAKAGVMAEGEAASLLRSVCSALAAAHDKGIVHRDLKPDNIFLVPDPDSPTGDRPKILDFGIAKLNDLGSASAATKTGAVMGTPTYMSPEQCRGSGMVDHRADLYSIGCIFYQLVAGRPPFASQGAGEVIGMHLYMQPDPPTKVHPGISPDTEAVIMALLQKDPAHRPQSARELAQSLGMLAQAHGWLSASRPGSHDGMSMPLQPTPHFTPAYAGPQPTPHLTPAVAAGPHQPTTLSGAASQSVVSAPKRRMGVGIAVAAAIVLVGGGIAFSLLAGGGGEIKPAAAPAPAITPTPPPPVPTPMPSPPVVTPPVTPPPPVATPTPTPLPQVDPPKKPIVTKPPLTKKPPVTKPDKKPDKKSPNGDLPIENSIE